MKKNKSTYFLILISFLLFNSNNLLADDESQFLMKKANELYKSKNYVQAENIYTELVSKGYEGTSLYYNLANTYFKENKIGYSILFYNKALKLSPDDEDIKHNLAIANTKTLDKIYSLPKFFLYEWWDSILSIFNLNVWTYVAYLFFIFLIVLVGIFLAVKNPRIHRLSFFIGIIVFVIFVLSASLLGVKLNREKNIKNGIILTSVVTVKLTPDENSNDAFVIHEGLKVRLEDNVDDWLEIRLYDGKVGWVKESDIGKI